MKLFSPDIQAAHVAVDTAPWSDVWFTDVGVPTRSGFNVTADTSQKVSAVFACIRLLSQTVGMLPGFLNERLKDNKGKRRVLDHPLHNVLHNQPNEWQTAMEFKEMITGHALSRGNGYARIIPGPDGIAEQLIPLHPDRMKVVRLPNTRIRYDFTPPGALEPIKYMQDEIFHLRGLSSDGLVGMSVVKLARESVGLSFATENHGATFFGRRAAPAVALKHPGHFSSKDVRDRVGESWDRAYGGPSEVNKTAVLEEGMDIQVLGVANEDSQFLETREFQITEIARWFHVPPHMIADLKRATFSNIEEQSLEFVVYSLMPWLKRWEQAIWRDLIIQEDDRFFFEFVVDALLRGNIKSRYEAYKTGITSGWMSRNEARALENLNPKDGLDDMLVPMNTLTVEQSESQQSSPASRSDERNTQPRAPAPLPVESERGYRLALAAAQRVIRKEVAYFNKADAGGITRGLGVHDVRAFYVRHVKFVSECLGLSQETAQTYCQSQCLVVSEGGIEEVQSWGDADAEALAGFALRSKG